MNRYWPLEQTMLWKMAIMRYQLDRLLSIQIVHLLSEAAVFGQ